MNRLSGRALPVILTLLAFAVTSLALAVTSSSSGDEDFVKKAGEGGMTEVALGRLALTKGHREDVRSFGRRMVNDHTAAGNKLKALATRKSIVLSTTLDAKDQAEFNRLSGLSGADFDRAYMELMVSDHETDVAEFQTEANSGIDPDVKLFASKTLPTLQTHLRIAKEVLAKLK